ncbi:DUF222 domain-containing protein [Microbispora hainanensis]|uniref:DUF222 domain-containing protein n=2 Tax=Microbispora TaxID=2005 RepID=A0ABZ1SRZ9_9ACTN|nr:DUF222 domain-containing protein [Microbispora hainanensis]
MAQELALTPLPDDVDMCLAEAEELLFARDRITCALADRVGRVHRAGQARQHGHASTRCWLRTSGGMTVGGAGRLLTLGAELPRLPVVREKFAAGELAAGVVEAICAAVAGLSDEQAGLAEPILVDLAGKAGAAEVAKAGRHLRAVLDPDGDERDERADYGRRFLRVRPGKGGGVEGEFYLPREAGARLMALLQAYAKLRAQGDDRPLTVRQADALIALLEQKIVTELLVVVSAESLPTDPETTDPTDDNPHPADDTSDPATQDPADPATQDPADPATDDPADHVEDARDAEGFEEGREHTGDFAPGESDDLDAAEAEAGAGAGSNADADGAADACTESAADTVAPAPVEAADNASDAMSGPGHASGADGPDGFDTPEADVTSDYTPDATGSSEAPREAVATGDCDSDAESADDPTGAEGAASDVMGDPTAGGTDHPAADGTGDRAPGEAGADAGAESAENTAAPAPAKAASTGSPSDGAAADACDIAEADASGVGMAETDLAAASATATDPASASARGSRDAAPGHSDEESCGCGVGGRGTGERRPGECELRSTARTACAEGDHTMNADSAEDDDTANTSSAESDETAPAKGDGSDRGAARSGATHARRGTPAWPAHGGGHWHTAPSNTAPSNTAPSGATASDAPPSQAAPSQAAPSEATRPDPPPEDVSARHTHAGPRPAGDCRHGHSMCRCDGEARCCCATGTTGTSGTPGAGRGTPGTAQAASQSASPGAAPGASPGAAPGASAGTMPGAFLGASLGASAGTLPGASLGSALGASASTLLGASLGASLGMAPGTAPGLLLATGQVLPVSSVHRLARTSTLVRIVMNADGQVLDMGRKVRLATPAQRRAIFARYATCWVDGCPLPATMCQIDHADNWSTGGLTDLKLLGPACQFHNRDRYQHPDRYTRRNVGEDRWAFTYHRLGRTRRLHE